MSNINIYTGPGTKQLVEGAAQQFKSYELDHVGLLCRDVRNPPSDLIVDDEDDGGAEMCRKCKW